MLNMVLKMPSSQTINERAVHAPQAQPLAPVHYTGLFLQNPHHFLTHLRILHRCL
jgi:hypothetical protein